MQIQPMPVPLANSGSEAAGRPQEGPTVTKAETPRPVEGPYKDPPPRFPYPDQSRGHTVDFEA
jgi:hypothetical protein